mgnify:CR=1 FL=1
MEYFTTIEVHGRHHVIKETNRLGSTISIEGKKTLAIQSNYRGTGMAFCGILKKGQSLDSFEKEYLARKKNPKPRKV